MTSSSNGGDNRYFEGNSSIPAAVGFAIPPSDQVQEALNAYDPAFNPATVPITINSLLGKQLQ
ncbi:UNVERIFIED_CONTAM: hypothetical protein Sradi_5305100 [Sesamum radiatum]|uniref:Uncharacterized protein n=1 Tax=Sesamum radiatum TaxID=300843 RepID=A0AAW2LQH7_SESRA